ncbi:DUF3135 domain-containing protein [Pseudomonas sp. gcc21]|uniref:DUF3135 domain-containing protein n=1 Tax=Pseudomonas sp. gcc21 TaxID=2726989 RepID=UPI001451AA23|nr:DUF3135 domain-containing protein [Pseudomonas sp. gcc21]QJD57819.1 DUF3135 domain-containing protein [Pseudomonas sp. gcc21]
MTRHATELPSFDELVEMAQKRPEELENLRQRMTDDILRDAPAERRRRLLGIVFRVDAERRRAKNPMQACIRISQMMMDSALELRDGILGPLPTRNEARLAEVVPLHKNRPSR